MTNRSEISDKSATQTPRAAWERNAHAIAAIMAMSVFYMLSDAAMKLASAIPSGERVFLRSFGVVLALSTVAAFSGLLGTLRRTMVPLMAARIAGDAGNSLSFQPALSRMPFADAMAVLQLTPLALTGAAALFLGDKVGWRRWTAIAIGFVGAMLVIKPGATSFNPWGLMVIVCVLSGVWRDLATRRFDPSIPPLLILLVSQAGVFAVSALSVLYETWHWPDSRAVLYLAVGAVLFAAGHLAAIYAVRDSDWSLVAPFRYAGIIWAIIIGFVLWGDLPDAWSMLGIALLVAAGLYTFHRERALTRKASA